MYVTSSRIMSRIGRGARSGRALAPSFSTKNGWMLQSRSVHTFCYTVQLYRVIIIDHDHLVCHTCH